MNTPFYSNCFGRKSVATALLLMAALVVGACNHDDKGSSGGSFTYAAPPTDRPTLTGKTVVIDTSGGEAPTAADGGIGGDIDFAATQGVMMTDAGPSRPGIDNNFLTSTVLADNTVSYTELTTIDTTAVNTSPRWA